jgi:zinc D-Ala-D-Ala dipeptidase
MAAFSLVKHRRICPCANSLSSSIDDTMISNPRKLVRITEASHGVLIDLIYASPANFTGRTIYRHALCLLHPDAEAALRRAVAGAAEMGLKLKVYDAFRPQEAQEALWAVAPLPGYIADPTKGSHHTRGVAVDVTLVTADGGELDMGTPVDTMLDSSHHFHAAHLAAVQLNRARLLTVMLEAGFMHYRHEWWHYQLPHASRYPLVGHAEFEACVQAVSEPAG